MAIPLSYNLRNLMVRRTSTLAASAGIAMVVLVFVLVLALAHGFAWAVQSAGSPLNAMVLRKGSESELTSAFERDQIASILVRPEIARSDKDRPLAVAELTVLAVLPRRSDGAPSQVMLRGTSEDVFQVRPQARIAVGGRMFQPGLPEIIVGKSISERIRGLRLGETVQIKRRDWKVVGIFETGGTGFESEIWGDLDVFQAAFDRMGYYQSITFRMADPLGIGALKASIDTDPKYQAKVLTEEQYYSDQAGTLSTFIGVLGTLITIVMSVGAVFGAMNTMYAAVGARAREIATLRALGFRRTSILVSFQIESMILSALGGVLGCLLALPLDGLTTGTINWDTFSELAFAFRVTPAILAGGFCFALVMGAVGGFLPALRASRQPIVSGLRQA